MNSFEIRVHFRRFRNAIFKQCCLKNDIVENRYLDNDLNVKAMTGYYNIEDMLIEGK